MVSSIKKRFCHVKLTDYMESGYEITTKINSSYNSEIDRSRKDTPSIRSAQVARLRAHSKLFGILRCQSWSYFVTLTFADAPDDESCRRKFQTWRKWIKTHYPDMYYLAVPEYQARGVLHYHLVVGGVTLVQLRCSDSGRVLHHGCAWRKEDFDRRGFDYDESTGEGMTIYLVDGWKYGYSTLTEIRDLDAIFRYVGKYITKDHLDPRFHNKRRYSCSDNVLRPFSCAMVFDEESTDLVDRTLNYFGSMPLYRDPLLKYDKYVTSSSKEERIKAFLYGELPD